ncbi:hypothetical protein Lfu02_20030 [Longispora fulva]|uniref:Uncharacterized protein n=1 Tax=Longispora fulva TaxID=619741 RepID=A0A8J7GLP2_9ACTN|nr:hypothetical protein [Longispora fulva]MBG6139990.1 hypothetical protein [Longispora fulva]GIG57631.1 hypothetical protein Lfu02_20030 [Longispora fulva]
MSERATFPKRDEDGRVAAYADLFAATLAMMLMSLVAVLLIDLVAVAFGASWGRSSGWLAVVLPAWLFVEEYRAWRVPGRIAIAALGILLGLVAGSGAAFLASYLPPLLSGGVGAAVTTLVYATFWFFGIRWLARRTGDGG